MSHQIMKVHCLASAISLPVQMCRCQTVSATAFWISGGHSFTGADMSSSSLTWLDKLWCRVKRGLGYIQCFWWVVLMSTRIRTKRIQKNTISAKSSTESQANLYPEFETHHLNSSKCWQSHWFAFCCFHCSQRSELSEVFRVPMKLLT